MDPSVKEEFRVLQAEGKQLAAEGKLRESLKKFLLAKEICPTEKVLQRIEKLKEHMKAYGMDMDKSDSTSEVEMENSPSVSNNITTTASPKVLSDVQNLEKAKYLSAEELSPKSQRQFRQLKNQAKELSYAGQYEEAIGCFQKALSIYNCPKVKRYIQEIERVMRNEKTNTAAEEVKSSSSQSIHESAGSVLGSDDQENAVVIAVQDPLVTEDLQNVNSARTNDDKKTRARELYYEARELAAAGELKDSLKLLKKSQALHETEKVQRQINKLEELLAKEADETEGDEMIKITEGFSVFHEIYNKLYPYQREGVAWMWNLYKRNKGGVLGDDMGLGKTFQVIAFLSGMIDAGHANHIMIIMPVSLITNWEREFKNWCPGISVHCFHGGTKKERERSLLRAQRRGHVLLTSYGMLVGNISALAEIDGREFVWDYVILDEGHKIKNPTKTTKAVHDVPSKNRLVLTGTPIQNNLRELWSLYDFVHQGALLGSLKTFKLLYENPITRSREKDATAGEKRLGTEMAENLKSLIKPYFLRRTKDEIWNKKTSSGSEIPELENGMEKLTISKLKAKKNDLILWTYMSESQIEIYQSFLHSDAVKSILVSKRSPLVQLTTLKKICDHPRLLSKRACLQLGLNGELREEELLQELEDESSAASSIENVSDETLLQESCKLNLVIELLCNLRETGHRTLVFSLSRKILDMIHRILVNRQWKVMRLDGTISKIEERERRIQKFQKDPSYPVFLLTTQVGGVGITLTSADRVIIYDPSWNPAVDAQAVDRVYRIGQERDVVVYRLITCGTVEEKIYRRQIFKDSITRQATGTAPDPHRYFSKQELRELFVLDNPRHSCTQVQLAEMHSADCNTDPALEEHIQFLSTLDIFGLSHHDLMFTREVQDHTEDNDQAAVSIDYIKKQVEMAHNLIQKEATVAEEGMRLAGTHSRPYQQMVPLPKKSSVKDTYKPPLLPDIVDLTEEARDVPGLDPSTSPVPLSNIIDLTMEPSCPLPEQRTNIPSPTFQYLVEQKSKGPVSPKDEVFYTPRKEVNTEDNKSEEPVSLEKSLRISNSSTPQFDKSLPRSFAAVSADPSSLSPSECDSIKPVIEATELPFESVAPSGTPGAEEEIQQSPMRSELPVDEEVECLERVASPEALLVNADLQQRFQNNLNRLMTEEDDVCFDDEVSNQSRKSRRKSCANKSTVFMSDSEGSQQGSCPPSLNSTARLVEESEEDPDSDSSSGASLSFVPDSETNTPTAPEQDFQTPSKRSENVSLLKKLNGSARRITPLKVDRSATRHDASFVKALEASPILTVTPYVNEAPSAQAETFFASFKANQSDSDGDDSPIKVRRRKKANLLTSDTEDSEDEEEGVRTSVLEEVKRSPSPSSAHSTTLFSEEESGEAEDDSFINDDSSDSDHESGTGDSQSDSSETY